MATLTVYPSLDGHLYDDGVQALAWAGIIAEPGTAAVDDGADGAVINISASTTQDKWTTLYRSIFLFDASALPDNCQIISATLSVYGKANKVDALSITPDINVYASDPASTTALAAGDFDSLGATAFCDTPITYANWNEGTPGTANEFILNAAGLAAISKTGITKFGLKNANYDAAGATPDWTSGAGSTLYCWFNEQGTTYRPKLVIEYAAKYPTPGTGALAGLTRVTNLIHRYNRATGVYTLEMALGEVTSDFGLPEWLTRPQPAVPEVVEEELTFQQRMERTAKQLQEEAGMSREESLRIARKLETMEEIERRERGVEPRKAVEPREAVPTREEFWRVYPGVPYPYGREEETRPKRIPTREEFWKLYPGVPYPY